MFIYLFFIVFSQLLGWPLHLPAVAAAHRMSMMMDASPADSQLRGISSPTLLLCSANDKLFNSVDEGRQRSFDTRLLVPCSTFLFISLHFSTCWLDLCWQCSTCSTYDYQPIKYIIDSTAGWQRNSDHVRMCTILSFVISIINHN